MVGQYRGEGAPEGRAGGPDPHSEGRLRVDVRLMVRPRGIREYRVPGGVWFGDCWWTSLVQILLPYFS